VLSPSFDGWRNTIVEDCKAPQTDEAIGPLRGQVDVTRWGPNWIDLHVVAEQPAVLVVNDAYYPGWRATVDGRPAPIRPANYAVRAVEVGRGSHRIEMRYATPWLRPAMLLAAFALALAFGIGGFQVRQERLRLDGQSARTPGC
jgi:uncharacterized membrane protein YfhO